jgi:hypothetical protein
MMCQESHIKKPIGVKNFIHAKYNVPPPPSSHGTTNRLTGGSFVLRNLSGINPYLANVGIGWAPNNASTVYGKRDLTRRLKG